MAKQEPAVGGGGVGAVGAADGAGDGRRNDDAVLRPTDAAIEEFIAALPERR
ncbi:hypothetical protein [Brevibacterium otitidis]|uniref:Uncharacterized protein n=1 Tax=Brevibacterium otitidis TaxID=53364 RepID=A0ABV5WXY3_9MICO